MRHKHRYYNFGYTYSHYEKPSYSDYFIISIILILYLIIGIISYNILSGNLETSKDAIECNESKR